MPQASDLKIYSSLNSGLGGDIDTTAEIISATPNNKFTNVTKAQLASDRDEYQCIYVKNTHATETMAAFSWWLNSDTLPPDTTVKWAFEAQTEGTVYQYPPYGVYNGTSDYTEIADSADLDLTTFTVCAWFRTSATYTTDGAIVNKGGFGSDSAGENMNYGIFIAADQKVKGEFEDATGTNYRITSTGTYNDGQWHFVCLTYDNATLKLYVDGNTTPVDSLSTTATPETNAKPLRIGANSRANDRHFSGDIDQVRIWGRALSSSEMSDIYNTDTTPNILTNLVYENMFGDTRSYQVIAQQIASITTAPVGVTWLETDSMPEQPNVGDFAAGSYFPVWVWWHTEQDAESRKDDAAIWSFSFFILAGDTGGSGGNPIPTPTDDLIIGAVGDWGCKSMTDTIIELIQDQNCTLVLGLGDGSYDDASATCWLTRMTPLKNKMESCFGNHDVDKSSKKNDILAYFGYNKTYFSVINENVYVLVMDTESSFGSGSAQYTFITADLQAASNNAAVKWKIAIMHRPWVGAESEHEYNVGNIMNTYLPLFDTHQVDLILVGHNHNMQRTYPFKSAGGSSTTKTDSTTGPYTKGIGRIHVVCGTGGHDSGNNLYSLGAQPSLNAYQNDQDNGILLITFTNSGNTMTCSLINTSGDPLDSWTMNG